MNREIPIEEVFQRNLKHLIDQRNCTRQELAQAIGVTANNITQWLLGNSLPRLNTLDRICAYFHVTRAYIVTDSAYNIVLMRESEKDMYTKYNAMNIEGKQKVNEYVDDLYSSKKHTKNTPLSSNQNILNA